MKLSEYIRILSQELNESGDLDVVDAYDNEPVTPEVVENVIVLADKFE